MPEGDGVRRPRSGARVVVAEVPFPLVDEEDVLRPVLAAVTPRTRLALLDHVTSPTALVFPIDRLVGGLRERGVETLVDGAHAPGMVPLDLDRLGAAYYTGNAHKWLCAPKGSAFLHVRRDRQASVHPVVISHGYAPDASGARFRAEFDWAGTSDPTPWLSIPEAIAFVGSLLPGGWPEVMSRNRALALAARETLLEALAGLGGSRVDDRVDRFRPASRPRPWLPRRGAFARRAHELVPRPGRRDVALPLDLRGRNARPRLGPALQRPRGVRAARHAPEGSAGLRTPRGRSAGEKDGGPREERGEGDPQDPPEDGTRERVGGRPGSRRRSSSTGSVSGVRPTRPLPSSPP